MTKSAEAGRKPGRGKIYASITDTIGDTPPVALDRLAKEKEVHARLLAKLEFFNPIASVKDRIGVAIIDALRGRRESFARAQRRLRADLLGATPALRLAFVAASAATSLYLAMPELRRSIDSRRWTHLGAELVLDELPEKGMKGSIARANELLAATPKARSCRNHSSNPRES